jgi:hypothetical protein
MSAQAFVALEETRALQLLVDGIDDELDGPRSWEVIDASLDGICRLARPLATYALMRLMGHEELQLRLRAAERLAALGDTEPLLRWLSLDEPEDVRVAAAWGLVKLGFPYPALYYVATHGPVLVPRFIALGGDGIRMLCACPVELFASTLDDVARRVASKRRHFDLLEDLAVEGSELAERALRHIDTRPRRFPTRRHLPLFGDETLSCAEWRDLEEAGVDTALLKRAFLATPNPKER